ncbi:hypothetical protein BH09BAC6_BH09BAC6_16190 [soil metagenome]
MNIAEQPPGTGDMLIELKKTTGTTSHHAIVHKKKNGEEISVDIQSNPVIYKGKLPVSLLLLILQLTLIIFTL